MINYLLEVSLCWLGFYLLYALWLSKETFFRTNRWYLVVTLLLGLCIPFSEMPAGIKGEEEALTYLETVTVTVHQVESQIATVVATSVSSQFSIQEILLWIYGLGVLLMFSRFLFGLAQIFKHYKKSQADKKSDYILVQNEEIHLPFSFFQFLFISASAKYTTDELENITRHELVHIKEGHSVDVLLLEILNILFWCSPLIYFYRRSLRNVHEYLADEKVLQTTTKKQYGQLLMQQFRKGTGVALANNFIHSQLKKRITMMTKNQSTKTARWKYLLVLPVFFCLFFVLSKSKLIAQINDSEQAEASIVSEQKKMERVHSVIKTGQGDPIFTVVEEMPRFPGCEEITGKEEQTKCSQQKMLEFVYKNIKYPEAARDAGIQGMAVVKFVVDKEGKVQSPEIVRTIGGGCDEEVLRVIGEMPSWVAGKQRGKNVAVYFNLPVRFKLQGEDDDSEKASFETKENKKNNVPNAKKTTELEDVFIVVEEMPRFPGCENVADKEERKECAQKKMLQFIYSNVKYPKEAQDAGTEGVVVVSFVIDKNGDIQNPEIARSVGHGLDEAVLDVVEKMNGMDDKWIAGKQRGKKVNVKFNLPVRFKLEGPAPAKEKGVVKNNTLEINSFSMSPNPAKNETRISFEADEVDGMKVTLTDLKGQTIAIPSTNFTKGKNELTIDLSNAAPGVLFVTLKRGEQVFTKQLVKQ